MDRCLRAGFSPRSAPERGSRPCPAGDADQRQRARKRCRTLARPCPNGRFVQGDGSRLAVAADALRFRICGNAAMITLDALDADGGSSPRFLYPAGRGQPGPVRIAQLRFRLGRSGGRMSRAIARSRWSRLDLPADRLVTCRQIHSAVVVTVESPWRREDAPRADGMVTRVPGIALGDSGGRLRAGPAPRSGRPGDRRGACRLARRARRRRRGDGGADGGARRRAAPYPRRDRPLHRPLLPTRSVRNFRGRSSPKIPPPRLISRRRGARPFHVRPRQLCRAPSGPRRGDGSCSVARTIPSPRRSASSAIAAPACGARPSMAAGFPPSRSTNDCMAARRRLHDWCCCWRPASRCRILSPTTCRNRARRC